MFFWNSLAFSMIQRMLAIWSLVLLPLLKPAWTSESSWFMYCWSLACRSLSITLLACEMSAIVWYLQHYFALPFFGTGMKTDLFQSCGHCWVFQICWHIECRTFTASSFWISSSSTGIPLPPLALFIVMIPKAHLTLHSRMSDSRWMITPSWWSGSWRSFLYSSSVYFCHLFLLSSAFVRYISFLSYIVPIFAFNKLLISNHTILGGSKITADGDCSHEIKRCLLLGRKVMTNLDSIFKSRDITFLTKVRLVKAMVFPVVM